MNPDVASSRPRRPSGLPALLVALAVAAVAAGVLFHRLGDPRMEPDEGLYALATDHVRATGEWLTLRPHPPGPYFNKPPLYVWLSAATYDLVPGFEAKYRAWSALFGAAGVGLTGYLAARLVGPAAGLVAGLLLATNKAFLFDHGARFGGMDGGLTACMAAVLACYLAGRGRTGRRVWPWIGVGLAAGVACLLKPLGGVPMLAVVGVHAVLFRRASTDASGFAIMSSTLGRATPSPLYPGERAGVRGVSGEAVGEAIVPDARPLTLTLSPGYRGEGTGHGHGYMPMPPTQDAPVPPFRSALPVLIVLATTLLVAGPWHLHQLALHGGAFARQFLGDQVARGALLGGDPGENQPWHYYLRAVPTSAPLFVLVIPAVIWLTLALRDPRRRLAAGLLLMATLGWVAGFSVSQKKFLHYAYPMFPAAAVAIAGMLAAAAARFASTFASRHDPTRVAPVAVRVVAAGLAAYAGYIALVTVPTRGSPLPAWTAYQALAPAVADGRVQLLLWGLPASAAEGPHTHAVRSDHAFYLSHMAGATEVADAAELSRRLATGRPAVVIAGRSMDVSAAPALATSAGAADDLFRVEARPYFVRAVGLGPIVRPTLGPGQESPYLALASPAAGGPATFAFTSTIAVDVRAPLPEAARLTLVVRTAADQPPRVVRPIVRGVGRKPIDLLPALSLGGTHRLTVPIDRDAVRREPRRRVELHLSPIDGGPDDVRAELVEAGWEVLPALAGRGEE